MANPNIIAGSFNPPNAQPVTQPAATKPSVINLQCDERGNLKISRVIVDQFGNPASVPVDFPTDSRAIQIMTAMLQELRMIRLACATVAASNGQCLVDDFDPDEIDQEPNLTTA